MHCESWMNGFFYGAHQHVKKERRSNSWPVFSETEMGYFFYSVVIFGYAIYLSLSVELGQVYQISF